MGALLEVSRDELLWMGCAQEGRSRWVLHAHPSIPASRACELEMHRIESLLVLEIRNYQFLHQIEGGEGWAWLRGYRLGMSLPSPFAKQRVYK